MKCRIIDCAGGGFYAEGYKYIRGGEKLPEGGFTKAHDVVLCRTFFRDKEDAVKFIRRQESLTAVNNIKTKEKK